MKFLEKYPNQGIVIPQKFQVILPLNMAGGPGTKVGTPNMVPVFPALMIYFSPSRLVPENENVRSGWETAKPAVIFNVP